MSALLRHCLLKYNTTLHLDQLEYFFEDVFSSSSPRMTEFYLGRNDISIHTSDTNDTFASPCLQSKLNIAKLSKYLKMSFVENTVLEWECSFREM